jgi:hypothetical protein
MKLALITIALALLLFGCISFDATKQNETNSSTVTVNQTLVNETNLANVTGTPTGPTPNSIQNISAIYFLNYTLDTLPPLTINVSESIDNSGDGLRIAFDPALRVFNSKECWKTENHTRIITACAGTYPTDQRKLEIVTPNGNWNLFWLRDGRLELGKNVKNFLLKRTNENLCTDQEVEEPMTYEGRNGTTKAQLEMNGTNYRLVDIDFTIRENQGRNEFVIGYELVSANRTQQEIWDNETFWTGDQYLKVVQYFESYSGCFWVEMVGAKDYVVLDSGNSKMIWTGNETDRALVSVVIPRDSDAYAKLLGSD